jgi:two-component system nitrogen regulation sensor histidine kinase GlnL
MSIFSALDLLATSVLVLDPDAKIVFANAAAENLLERPRKALVNLSLPDVFLNAEQLLQDFKEALQNQFADKRQDLVLERFGHDALHVHCTVSVIDNKTHPVLIELRENIQQLKLDREERFQEQNRENKELIRNLAHEIKNPLGGVRGAAQLLELELPEQDVKGLKEYTQVIIKEADRLQVLVDRLLAPNRTAQNIGDVNIHEVCEHVLRLISSEYNQGLHLHRDYDLSIPEFRGDQQQLIQVILNIAQNAAQALHAKIKSDHAHITFKTRVVRQVTIAKQRHKLALDLHIIDNGPGIAADICDRIFYPLVTGREGGTGLGLTLAQAFVAQHAGVIDCESKPGCTDFRILLPLS